MNDRLNPNSELEQSIVSVPDLAQVPEEFLNMAQQFQEAMMMYTCAIREVKTKIEVLNDELSVRNSRNPIEMIKSRVKKPRSIVEKLRRRGLEVSLESMIANLDDVAGIRIICSFLDDIYAVADMLVRQDDIRVIAVKDYIKNPKPNGYKSYHMVVTVPVYLTDGPVETKVEIQIRSVAMDFWASLEHKIAYKFEGNAPEGLLHELKDCADVVDMLDKKMFSLNEAITAYAKEHQETDPDREQI